MQANSVLRALLVATLVVLGAACTTAEPDAAAGRATGDGGSAPEAVTTSATPAATTPPMPPMVADTLEPSFVCPVTEANGASPLGEPPSPNYHGNGEIFTALWRYGVTIINRSHQENQSPDAPLVMKFPWWRPSAGTELTIEGRRLDAEAPPLDSAIPDGYDASEFQASGLLFPTPGCWEVIARSGGSTLTFVTLVVEVP